MGFRGSRVRIPASRPKESPSFKASAHLKDPRATVSTIADEPANDSLAAADADVRLADRLLRFLPLLVVGLAGALAMRRMDNTDTWWHLAAGRWIVEHRSIPSTDVLSWTVRNHAWINVQWLYDVVLYGLFRLGGPSLLVLTSVLCYSTATALLLVNLRRHVGPVTAAALGAWAVVISQERFAIRPEMVSYALIQVILLLYATGRVPGSKRLWWLPAVMCLFANTHSLFIVGAVIVLCQMAGAVLSDASFLPSGWRRRLESPVRKQILVTGVAALAATAVNPYFLRGAFFPLELMSRISGAYPFFRTIGEFRRPFTGTFASYSIKAYRIYFVLAAIVLMAALLAAAFAQRRARISSRSGKRAERRRLERKGARRAERSAPHRPEPVLQSPAGPTVGLDVADIAILLGVGYLSLLARRNMALFAMAGGPAVASCLAVLGSKFRIRSSETRVLLRRGFAVLLLGVFLVGGWLVVSNDFYRRSDELHEFGLGMIDFYFPMRAVEFIRKHDLPRPLFNDFTSGAYFTWSPPVPGGVYVDPRTEVYDAEFLGPYMRQVQRPAEWQAEMDRRGIQTVSLFHWWPNHQALSRYLLRGRNWAVVYYDETSIIAVRPEHTEAIARARADFPPERETTERRLLEGTPSWQYPIARARGLTAYSQLLRQAGRQASAARFQQELARVTRRQG